MVEVSFDWAAPSGISQLADRGDLQDDNDRKSILTVRMLSANEITFENSSILYKLDSISKSEGFVIHFGTTLLITYGETGALAEHEIVIVNDLGSLPIADSEEVLQLILERLDGRTVIIQIIVLDAFNVPSTSLVIALFIPVSTSCISVEFRRRKRGSSVSCHEVNLQAIFTGLYGLPAS